MIASKIRRRIRGKGRGTVWTPFDFLNLGPRTAIDMALSRLTDQGVIRRLAHGIYEFPKVSPRLGALLPKADDVARAIARKDGGVLLISRARAANMLGLTTQVPAKMVYLTDGPTRIKKIGTQTIELRHASANTLIGAGRASGTVFQALRYLGKDGVVDAAIHQIIRSLGPDDAANVRRDRNRAPGWMQPIVDQIAEAA